MFLVIFTALLGNDDVKLSGTNVKLTTYYVVAMATFGVISACYTNIAISVCFQRDAGILKRTRGTPLPGWGYVGGRVIHAMIVGVILVVITLAFGKAFYDGRLPTGIGLVEFVVTFAVGALALAALALALTSIVPNADAAPPVVNASILPLLFLSGIFFALTDGSPAWIKFIGNVFPIKHFADAMISAYLSNVTVSTPAGTIHPFVFEWSDILVIAAWGVAGLILAARFFSWEPRK
jgi:ABC-2 type transport system permease protein